MTTTDFTREYNQLVLTTCDNTDFSGEDAFHGTIGSRKITPKVTPKQKTTKSNGGGYSNNLAVNGGDIEAMEFKINEVTNNPVPTDIFTFKRLANQNARMGTMRGVRGQGLRTTVRRNSNTPNKSQV